MRRRTRSVLALGAWLAFSGCATKMMYSHRIKGDRSISVAANGYTHYMRVCSVEKGYPENCRESVVLTDATGMMGLEEQR